MRTRRHVLAVLAAATGLLTACGGNPTGPSPSEGVVLDGTVLGGTAAARRSTPRRAPPRARTQSPSPACENPAITATVGADGRFTLRGLPAGGFTLEFTQGATSLGSAQLRRGEAEPGDHDHRRAERVERHSRRAEAQRDRPRRPRDRGPRPAGACSSTSPVTAASSSTVTRWWPARARPRSGRATPPAPSPTSPWADGCTSRAPGCRPRARHSRSSPPRSSCRTTTAPRRLRPAWPGAKAEVEGKITAKRHGQHHGRRSRARGSSTATCPTGTPIRKGNTSYTFDAAPGGLAGAREGHGRGTRRRGLQRHRERGEGPAGLNGSGRS